MRLRRALRNASPEGVRVAVALARRSWRDSPLFGARPRLVRRETTCEIAFPHVAVELVQEIRQTAYFEGKLANIRLGAGLLDGVVVAPGETLSFWKLVGRPTAGAGFQLGRSIRGGAVAGDIGGGLCQLSGIAYEAGLRAELEVVERHPHSRDLYSEEERFTPLGLDATVVWPYKDLRLSNRLAVPVQFRFEVRGLTLSASIRAPRPIEQAALEIERSDEEGWRRVVVRRRRGGAIETVSEDRYAFTPA